MSIIRPLTDQAQKNGKECQTIRVLIAHGNPLFRLGLRSTLERHEMQIIGETAEREQILERASNAQPDVVIFDGTLTFRDSYEKYSAPEVVSQIRQTGVGGIIVLVPEAFEEHLFQFLMAGAAAYELDRLDGDDFIEKVRLCAQGEYLMTSEVLQPKALPSYQTALPSDTQLRRSACEEASKADPVNSARRDAWGDQTPEQLQPPESQDGVTPSEEHCHLGLTKRNIEVLQCVLHGLKNKEIAKRLAISDQTVKNHLTRILGRLTVHDRTAAVVTVLRHGLITLSDALPEQQASIIQEMPDTQNNQGCATSHAVTPCREELAV